MFKSLYHLIFPNFCPGCHQPYSPTEGTFCARCHFWLPTFDDAAPCNRAENRLRICFQLEHGASFARYYREETFSNLIKAAKYHGQPGINRELTQLFIPELDRSGWPFDITCIMPVPIHWSRRLVRGYNQAEPIARTLGEHWHLPVDTHSLYKRRYTSSQVTRSYTDREVYQQKHHPFNLRHPERLVGQHVLLVDDVLTTGATITTCAKVLLKVPGLRVSFLTLAMTRKCHG
jgi:ComF family protein